MIVERLNKEAKFSFVLQKDVYPYYPTPSHYHPEYELVLVLKSSGEKIVGDHISSFSDGDLTFMGPFLPHVYHNSKIYYEENSNLTAEAIVIHFTKDFLGNHFFNIPEMDAVASFLEDSVMGFSITGKTRQLIAREMNDMLKMSGPLRIIELLIILHILAETKEKKRLASPGFIQNFKTSGSEQITKVCDFNFFKRRTRKTFVNFLNEVRIGYACKLLSSEQHNITEVCYTSGFQNLSNFNRQFKRIVNKTPHQYRKDILLMGIRN